ncbi:MAG: hypothetical protein ACRYF9_15940 [Janthinobacterium lividum]|nr:hypothetical protein [Pseudomonas sp. MWU16-30317]
MKALILGGLLLLAGCKYFGYQESCTDNPDRPECDGSHQVEGHRK